MSDVFSDQFKEFKDEVIEMMKARPAGDSPNKDAPTAVDPAISNF